MFFQRLHLGWFATEMSIQNGSKRLILCSMTIACWPWLQENASNLALMSILCLRRTTWLMPHQLPFLEWALSISGNIYWELLKFEKVDPIYNWFSLSNFYFQSISEDDMDFHIVVRSWLLEQPDEVQKSLHSLIESYFYKGTNRFTESNSLSHWLLIQLLNW